MFNPQYKLYINNVWFESLFPTSYYYDKRIFFTTGARRFFTIYQVLRTGDFVLTVVNEETGERQVIQSAAGFREWVQQHYDGFLKCLDSVDWGDNADAILKPLAQ